MKLYLSSYRIPDTEALFELFDKSPEELKGAIITNAKDQKPEEDRRQKLGSLKEYLGSIGLRQTSFVDLRTATSPDELSSSLGIFD